MDFDLTEDQQLLTQTLDRLLADHYDFERRKSYASSALGWSREQWQRYAEMGLLGLPFAEADGGLGGGAQAGSMRQSSSNFARRASAADPLLSFPISPVRAENARKRP